MKNVLYISYDGMSDQLGQSQVLPYLFSLQKFGYNITLISCEKKKKITKDGDFLRNMISENGIVWKPVSYMSWPPVISTLINIFKIKGLAINIVKQHNIGIVHCRSYIPALLGLNLKRRFNTKFIFDMRGFWANERLDGGIWNLKNPVFNLIYKFFKRKEKEFLNKSDFIISLTENAKREILSWRDIRIEPTKIRVIPCCIDLDLFAFDGFDQSDVNKHKQALKIQDDELILVYLGALGTWYMLDEMLDFFVRLKEQIPKFRFLFLTQEDKTYIYKQAKEKGISDDSLIITKVNRAEVPVFLSLAHLSIFFIKPLFSKKASSPTKQGELMGMGIPVICNAGIGDTDEVIKKFKSGFLVDQFTTENYDLAIQHIDQLLKLDKGQIREGADTFYSLKKGVDSYVKVYHELSKKE